jgi:hypothetical protein
MRTNTAGAGGCPTRVGDTVSRARPVNSVVLPHPVGPSSIVGLNHALRGDWARGTLKSVGCVGTAAVAGTAQFRSFRFTFQRMNPESLVDVGDVIRNERCRKTAGPQRSESSRESGPKHRALRLLRGAMHRHPRGLLSRVVDDEAGGTAHSTGLQQRVQESSFNSLGLASNKIHIWMKLLY